MYIDGSGTKDRRQAKRQVLRFKEAAYDQTPIQKLRAIQKLRFRNFDSETMPDSETTVQKLPRFRNYGSETTVQKLRFRNYGSETTVQKLRFGNYGSETNITFLLSNFPALSWQLMQSNIGYKYNTHFKKIPPSWANVFNDSNANTTFPLSKFSPLPPLGN